MSITTPSAIRKTPATISTAHAKRALLARHHIVAPSLRVAEAASASVFGAARLRGPIARDVIAQTTGLSIATVNRQVTALLDAGVLRERADLAVSGAIGRPRVPVEVNHEPFLTLGHAHRRPHTTSIVATDLFGRTLDVVETPTPRGFAERRSRRARGECRALPEPLAPASVRSGWAWPRVASSTARPGTSITPGSGGPTPRSDRCSPKPSDYPCHWPRTSTRWPGRSCCSVLDGTTSPPGRPRAPACTSTPGRPSATPLSIGGRVHSPTSGPGTIAALPAHSELLGGTGQLESTVSEEAVLVAARKLRVVPADGPASSIAGVLRAARQGNERAVELLAERARVLGESVALLRDMLNPDDPRRRWAGLHGVSRGPRAGRVRLRPGFGARAP